MSRTTIAEAKAELYGELTTNGSPSFSVPTVNAASIQVYDHEPRGQSHPITVTIATAGMTPTDWVLAVRIYVSTSRLDAKIAQDQLDLLVPAVDEAVGANGGFGPSDWEITWDPELDALVATCILNVGRHEF